VDEIRRLELRVGLITLVAIALFLLGITWARGVRLGVAEREIRFRFPSAAGIEPGAPIVVYGVRQGSVTAVEIEGASVLIRGRISGEIPLRRDAAARIGLQELTGGRKIDLFPGNAPEPLPQGAEIPGTTAPELAELLLTLGQLAPELRTLVARLDTAATSLVVLLSPQTQRSLRQAVEDLSQVAQRLRAFTESHGDELGRAARDIAAVSAQLRALVERQGTAVEATVAALQRTSTTAERTITQVESLVGELQQTVQRLQALLQRLQEGKTLAARLLSDEELARQLDTTLVLVRDFLEQVQRYGINVNVRLGTRP